MIVLVVLHGQCIVPFWNVSSRDFGTGTWKNMMSHSLASTLGKYLCKTTSNKNLIQQIWKINICHSMRLKISKYHSCRRSSWPTRSGKWYTNLPDHSCWEKNGSAGAPLAFVTGHWGMCTWVLQLSTWMGAKHRIDWSLLHYQETGWAVWWF